MAEVFGQKKRINLEDFKRINTENTSEMFLSIMILLQNSLPCTENFYRYQKNFEKYISNDGEGDSATPDANQNRPASGGKVQTIASPRMMSNSPLASLAKQHGINFNPSGTHNMLKVAANKPAGTAGEEQAQANEEGSGEVNVGNFRSSKQDKADKMARQEELVQMKEAGTD